MVPRVKLAHLPTPIEYLPRLSKKLGKIKLFVKRDDQTGLAFGGNKTRKLEFLLADALEKKACTVITGGAVQSNHCRQTAAAAARLGLDCVLVLSGEEPPTASGNLLLDRLFGAELVYTPREKRDFTMKETFSSLLDQGRSPYLIPYGGSNAVGATSYAYAIQETLEQIHPELDKFQWIVFGSSSGGTQAGLVAGAKLFHFSGNMLGISIDEPESVLCERVARLGEETAAHMGSNIQIDPAHVLVNADYCGGGYGVMDAAEREAIHMFARYEGLLLDPVYTGRAGAGLIDLIRKRFFPPDSSVLFWHTGGTPALLAERYSDVV